MASHTDRPDARSNRDRDRDGGRDDAAPDFRAYLRQHLPSLAIARETEIVEELAEHLEEIYRDARSAGLDRPAAFARAVAAVPATAGPPAGPSAGESDGASGGASANTTAGATADASTHATVGAIAGASADDLACALRDASRSSPGRAAADRVRAALREPGPSFASEGTLPTSGWRVMWLGSRYAINPRLALRTLFRSPFVTIVALVSLALGIGVNAAVFSLFHQLLLRPLPVPEPNRLVNLAAPGPKPGGKSYGFAGDFDVVFSYPMFRDLERVQTPFAGLAAHRSIDVNLSPRRGETAVAGRGMLVSGGYFSTLALQPALGRLLGPADDRVVGESPVVVLSHAYWQSSFGGRADVLDQPIVVNGHAMTIVGVAPAGFEGTTLGVEPQVFVPITMRWTMQPGRAPERENRRNYWVYLFARLKPGVSIEQARSSINVPYHAIVNDVEVPLHQGMSEQTMAEFKRKAILVAPGARGQSDVSADLRVPLTLLIGVTLLVLLIACVNIANLLLVRAAGRASEMAMRLSIGASRGHLIAQLLTESSLLAMAGGVISLLVARWTMALIASLVPAEAVQLPLHLDSSALIATAALALGTSLLVGLFPALHATRPDVLWALKGWAGQPAGARGAARFRIMLATAQIALSMVLVVLAGLFARSLANMNRVSLGLNLEGLVTFEISPERNAYAPERSALLVERLEDELGALPGVTSVASARLALLSRSTITDSVHVEGFEVGPDTDNDTLYDEIGPGYFRTLGVPLLAGREFTRADSLKASKVVIVNEQFARKFRLGRTAVGKRMSTSRASSLDLEIVGLVKDARLSDVKGEVKPTMFLSHRQAPQLRYMTFYVRSSGDPNQVMAMVRETVFRVDPQLPLERLRTMRSQVRDEVMVIDRFMGVLTASFAALATLLAAIGLYGVLAYTVAQRTREIGLRMALGATRARVRQLVLRQVGLMTIVGGTIGLAAALAVARAARTLLFALPFNDPGVFVGAAIVLTLVALAAGLIPADRAARVDPMRALKYE